MHRGDIPPTSNSHDFEDWGCEINDALINKIKGNFQPTNKQGCSFVNLCQHDVLDARPLSFSKVPLHPAHHCCYLIAGVFHNWSTTKIMSS